ncbi:MAG: hypothetical protein JWO52_7846 [Gammaproteobacteria bacterium]|nr:hypothetical protein [Gammaproteobacteria bacterium]
MKAPRNADELDPDAKPDRSESFLDKPQNVSDAPALKEKAISDKVRWLRDENDLRAVLLMPEGVRVIAQIIERCGWNTPYFHPNNSHMSEIAGRRSIAWQLEQAISDVDLELWFAVRRELETLRPKPVTSVSKPRSKR